MSIDIHLDRDKYEIDAARTAIAGVLASSAALGPELASKTSDAVLQALFDQFGGGRVYFPLRRAKDPEATLKAIEAALRGGRGVTDIAKELKISRVTVWRIRKRMEASVALSVGLGDAL